jgi:translation initiation factor IF-1
MVRNIGGGDRMKHMARKHINGAKNSQSKILRTSSCPDEIYSYVTRILGNGMCLVKGIDGYERLCHIRGKFTGRSKRENTLVVGTWVLVGLRQWDAEKEFASKQAKTTGKKIQKCDLLEIYSPAEREKLRVQEKIFQDVASENSDDEFQSKNTVEFKDQATLEYQEIVEQGGTLSRMKKSSYNNMYDDISDSDDSDGDRDSQKIDEESEDESVEHKTTTTAAAAEAASSFHQNSHKESMQKKSYDFQTADVNIDDI